MRHPVPRSLIIKRGLMQACPNCGSRSLFLGRFRLRYRCPGCGLKLSRSDGFFLGAMVWNYGLTVFGALPVVLLCAWLFHFPKALTVGLCVGVGLIMPILIYRFAWGLWLASYYFVLPHELPANATEAIPADEDE